MSLIFLIAKDNIRDTSTEQIKSLPQFAKTAVLSTLLRKSIINPRNYNIFKRELKEKSVVNLYSKIITVG